VRPAHADLAEADAAQHWAPSPHARSAGPFSRALRARDEKGSSGRGREQKRNQTAPWAGYDRERR